MLWFFSIFILVNSAEEKHMNNMDTFMNAIIFIAGGYLIYSAYMMKTKGVVASALLGRDIDWDHAKEENKAAYIKIMFPANMIMGLIMIAPAAVFTVGSNLGLDGIGETAAVIVSLLFCVIYGTVLMHAQNKYLK